MSRAVLMQSHGDPCLTSYWLRNFERVYRDEVDELRVLVNRQNDPRIIDFLRSETERVGGIFRHEPRHLIHGQATRLLVADTDAYTVLLIEDDAFVRRPGAVNDAFDRIDQHEADVIATPRHGMSPELEEYAREKWGREEPRSPEGNVGYGLWPCFVFARTSTLRMTSQRYESWSWAPGQTVPGIEYPVGPSGVHTDSFTTTAFEMRGLGLHIEPGEQWKELWNRDLPEDYDPAWFHAGGLSNGDFLNYRNFGNVHDCGGNNEGLDWGHRLWWWMRAYEKAPREALTDEQWLTYGENLNRLMRELNVEAEVKQWGPRALPWITWNDSP